MPDFLKFICFFLTAMSVQAQTFTASIIAPTSRFCTNLPIVFAVSSSGVADSYSWSVVPNNGVTFSPSQENAGVTITFPSAINYTVSVKLTSGSQSITAARTVPVAKNAKANFNASLPETGFPAELYLTNYSSNTIDTYWSFSDVAQRDSSFNVVKKYTAPGSYSVMLYAIGKNGCNDSLRYSFSISGASSIVLPNVFTPNDDGVNDIFRPIMQGISHADVYVYNRYGTMISSWNRINGSWDGRTTSGEPCSSGVYFVIVNAQGFDKKEYKLQGSLTLLR